MNVYRSGFLASLFVVAGVVGCGPSVNVTRTAPKPLPASDVNHIAVLEARPTRAYDEVGLLTTKNNPSYGLTKAYSALRTSAATLGADAVVITSRRNFQVGFQKGFDLEALAIKYK